MNRLGALKSIKEIWELVIIPSLLSNSEMFYIEDKNIQKLLEDFQNMLYRLALAVPKSCLLPALPYESDSWLMKYRVYYRIINFVKHIHSQDINTNLSKQILSEQLTNNWQGQGQVAQELCNELNIHGLFNQDISKAQFKISVRRACQLKSEEDLITQINSYKKMTALREESEKGNAYFFRETLENVRTLFRFRTDLYEAKLNFKNKYKNENYLCDSCESESEDSTHILNCPAYAHLRVNKSLNSDKDLAKYLQKVLEIRTEL